MAAVLISACTTPEVSPNVGVKRIIVITPATADPGDTVAVTLANYGMTGIYTVDSFVHTTDGSIIVGVANTTAVSAGVLTVTLLAGDGNTDKERVIEITGY